MEKTEYIDLRGDGRIVLYQRPNLKNPRYEVRISLPMESGYVRKSSRTSDFRLAKAFAEDLYEEYYFKVKKGGTFKSKTYRQVFDDWKIYKLSSGTTKNGGTWEDTVKTVEDYSVKYFGAYKIDQIKTFHFSEYFEWRKTNFNKVSPSNNTLIRERTCIRSLLSFCVERGYLQQQIVIPKPTIENRRRPTFDANEYKKISRNLREWVKDAEGKPHYRSRFIFQQYFLVLANTGMRIGEIRNIRWGDIKTQRTDDDSLICWVDGKTGRREVVFQKGADEYLQRMFDMRKEFLGTTPDSDEVIFINYVTNKPFTSFKNAMKSVLAYSGVKEKRDGMNRTIYSLRHYYATQRLSAEVSPFLLAQQMGTSTEMLKKYYGHVITSDVARQISKTTSKMTTKDLEGSYPWKR